mmetsp:Transcript_12278/g.31075  ORF Transcript_12278/g.31075 Transcript_12278/m.31075 type:complete len:213 (+) Transcript_12278:202-840(+)
MPPQAAPRSNSDCPVPSDRHAQSGPVAPPECHSLLCGNCRSRSSFACRLATSVCRLATDPCSPSTKRCVLPWGLKDSLSPLSSSCASTVSMLPLSFLSADLNASPISSSNSCGNFSLATARNSARFIPPSASPARASISLERLLKMRLITISSMDVDIKLVKASAPTTPKAVADSEMDQAEMSRSRVSPTQLPATGETFVSGVPRATKFPRM